MNVSISDASISQSMYAEHYDVKATKTKTKKIALKQNQQIIEKAE